MASSLIWKYFRKFPEEVLQFGVCLTCHMQVRINNGRTGTLETHLMYNHSEEYKEMINDWVRVKKESDKTTEADPRGARGSNRKRDFQTEITNFLQERQKKHDLKLMIWIAMDHQPFSVCDSKWFKQFINHIEPWFKMKSASTMAMHVLPFLYQSLKDSMMKLLAAELPYCNLAAFTTETFTCQNNESFLSLILHYINNDFLLRKVTIGVIPYSEKHTGSYIADQLDKLIRSFRSLAALPKRICVVDQTPNIRSALSFSSKLESFANGSVTCFHQKLQIAFERTVESQPQIKGAIDACRIVTNNIQQSHAAEQIVIDRCKAQNVLYTRVPAPVALQWNSVQKMLRRINSLRQVLTSLRNDEDFEFEIPTEEQFNIAVSLLPILKAIRTASISLSTDKVVTMDRSLLVIRQLFDFAANQMRATTHTDQKTGLQEFYQELVEQLEKRFPEGGTGIISYSVGNLLHPHFKGFTMDSLGRRDDLIKDLVDNHPSTKEYNTRIQKAELQTSVMPECLKDDPESSPEFEFKKCEPPLKAELNMFIRMMKEEYLNVDVLAWWKMRTRRYPKLAQLARDYYCIPACSASSRRSLSKTGLAAMEKRQTLDPATADKLAFINDNFEFLEPFVDKWNYDSLAAFDDSPDSVEEVVKVAATVQQDSAHDKDLSRKRGLPKRLFDSPRSSNSGSPKLEDFFSQMSPISKRPKL